MKKGFTLIELIIVLSIVGILAALFIPALDRALNSNSEEVQTQPQPQLNEETTSFGEDTWK